MKRREIWIIIIALLIFLIPAFFTFRVQQRYAHYTPSRSTYSTSPSGLKGLYLTLRQLGIRVGRIRIPPADATKTIAGILFIVEPSTTIELSTWNVLLNWVMRGNVLFISSENAALLNISARGLPPAPPMPVSRTGLINIARPLQPSPVLDGIKRYVVGSAIRLSRKRWVPREVRPFDFRRAFGRPRKPSGGQHCKWEQLAGEVPLLADKFGIVMKAVRVGDGWIFLHASPYSLSNQGIARGDNLRLVLNIIEQFCADDQRGVWFDEYHHGHRQGLWRGLPEVVRWGIIQAVLALLLVMLSTAKRFGAPTITSLEPPRERSEFLSSMALLFKRARATQATVRLLKMQFIRDALKMPYTLSTPDIDQIVERLMVLPTQEAEEIARLIDEANRLERKEKLSEGEVLRLAIKMREIVRRREQWSA